MLVHVTQSNSSAFLMLPKKHASDISMFKLTETCRLFKSVAILSHFYKAAIPR